MSKNDTISSFKPITMNHPFFNASITKIMRAIKQADVGDIIFLYGPTGVGKSTLSSCIDLKLKKEFNSANDSVGTLASIVVEAPYPDSQRFSWKDFYRRALIKLQEPLIDKKVSNSRCSAYGSKVGYSSDPAVHALRMAMENALKYRKVKVLIIDEAHHIAKGFRASGLQDQLEYVKSLANLTGTVIVLIGTYDLLTFRNLSGQLSRRSIDVHFPRYRCDIAKEHQMFINVLESFVKKLPIPTNFNILDISDDLYTGSVGCVGLLSGWLKKALANALEENADCLRIDHFKSSSYSYAQLSKIIADVQQGEALLTTPPNGMSELKLLLNVPIKTPVTEPIKKNRNRFGVGHRKPVRDKVGGHG